MICRVIRISDDYRCDKKNDVTARAIIEPFRLLDKIEINEIRVRRGDRPFFFHGLGLSDYPR